MPRLKRKKSLRRRARKGANFAAEHTESNRQQLNGAKGGLLVPGNRHKFAPWFEDAVAVRPSFFSANAVIPKGPRDISQRQECSRRVLTQCLPCSGTAMRFATKILSNNQ